MFNAIIYRNRLDYETLDMAAIRIARMAQVLTNVLDTSICHMPGCKPNRIFQTISQTADELCKLPFALAERVASNIESCPHMNTSRDRCVSVPKKKNIFFSNHSNDGNLCFDAYVVGSSSHNTVGLLISSSPTDNRFFCPPDNLSVIVN
jgi:hypothetical protein